MKLTPLTSNLLGFALSLVALALVSCLVPFVLTIQAYCLFLAYVFLRNWSPVKRLLDTMPTPHVFVFALLIGGIVGGHFTLNTTCLFPFMSWAIFPMVDERDPVTCRELLATTQSGKQTRLLVEQLIPSIIQFNLPDEPTPGKDALTPTVVAAARVYNQLHPNDPVAKIDLVKIFIPLHPAADTPFPICEHLRTYSFVPFPSN